MVKAVFLILLVLAASLSAQELSDLIPPPRLAPGDTLVVGFLGGFDRWHEEHRGVRKLALRLRDKPRVHAETVSNHHRETALAWLMRSLDTDGSGILDPAERTAARVILYGQSWGAAAALHTARDLDTLGIPVLLTVQIDSVGRGDHVIPANVRSAVNFYQHDPLTIQGRGSIHAGDPARTKILGNFERSYMGKTADPASVSWVRRRFGGSHAAMEADPVLWKQVERYIDDAIQTR